MFILINFCHGSVAGGSNIPPGNNRPSNYPVNRPGVPPGSQQPPYPTVIQQPANPTVIQQPANPTVIVQRPPTVVVLN